jgi:hypothetical protein
VHSLSDSNAVGGARPGQPELDLRVCASYLKFFRHLSACDGLTSRLSVMTGASADSAPMIRNMYGMACKLNTFP